MNGVEVLSATQVVSETVYNYNAAWIVAGIIISISLVVGIIWAVIEQDAFCCTGALLVGILLATIVSVFVLLGTAKPVAYETQYKVTISDSVSLTEFNDKYEILDQEGRIYTVRERVAE